MAARMPAPPAPTMTTSYWCWWTWRSVMVVSVLAFEVEWSADVGHRRRSNVVGEPEERIRAQEENQYGRHDEVGVEPEPGRDLSRLVRNDCPHDFGTAL